MADIDIQHKSTPVWPWILGIIVVVAIILFLVAGRDRGQMDNYGGGAIDTGTEPATQPLEPTPENPGVPQPSAPVDGRNPQVAPPYPDQPQPEQFEQPEQPQAVPPGQGAYESTETPGGAYLNDPSMDEPSLDDQALEYEPADPVFTDQIAQQDLPQPGEFPEDNLPGEFPEDENVVIEDDLDDGAILLEDEYPAEVTAFTQFLLQNSDTQAEFSNTFTSDGLRNLASALYSVSDQGDITDTLSEQNREELNLLADQIAISPTETDQANLAATAFAQAAAWFQELSTTLYPDTEAQVMAVQEAADNFDPEGQLSLQLPAVRTFFDRADTALQDMALP